MMELFARGFTSSDKFDVSDLLPEGHTAQAPRVIRINEGAIAIFYGGDEDIKEFSRLLLTAVSDIIAEKLTAEIENLQNAGVAPDLLQGLVGLCQRLLEQSERLTWSPTPWPSTPLTPTQLDDCVIDDPMGSILSSRAKPPPDPSPTDPS